MKKIATLVQKPRLIVMGNQCADHATPVYPQNLALNFADQLRSLSIVCLWTKNREVWSLCLHLYCNADFRYLHILHTRYLNLHPNMNFE
jgi:hypothetical protein